MIEIICKEDLQKEEKEIKICLPKNIRQIGGPKGRHKIYIEDYVYTYLKTAVKKKDACAAVFLGKSLIIKDIRYTFISGTLECAAEVFQWNSICLDDGFWEYIDKEQKQYFPETEIVGWFLGRSGQDIMELPPAVEAAHRRYFAGRDKVLMLMDSQEDEETFYIYEQGYLQKREGYYIYYEKNVPMQEYMIKKREEELRIGELAAKAEEEGLSPEFVEIHKELEEGNNTKLQKEAGQAQEKIYTKSNMEEPKAQEKIYAKSNIEEPKTQAEEALESYRYMILEKQGRQIERQNRRFLYTASSFFLVIICVIGITTINNYKKMREVEEALHIMEDDGSTAKRMTDTDESLMVESVDSQVTPLEENPSGQAGETDKLPLDEGTGDLQQDGMLQPDKDARKEGANEIEKGADKPQGTGEPDGQQEKDASGQSDDAETADSEEPAANQQTQAEADDQQEETNNQQEETNDQQEETNDQQAEDDAAAGQAAETEYYIVKKGDTLAGICFNIYHSLNNMQKICEINGIENGDKIFVGQKLRLP